MLTRWNDFGLGADFAALDQLRREVDRMFSDFAESGDVWPQRPLAPGRTVTRWPRVSVRDAGPELHLRAEVPGLSEKDLDISLEQSSLTIKGERKIDVPEGYSVHRQERGAISFARSFTLPCRIDAERTTANLKDGVLEMTLPKVAAELPRQIEVRSS